MPTVATALPPRQGLRTLRWSGLIALAGVGPLLLYGVFGPADGNPIGLGLLAVLSVPAAAVLALVGIVQWLVEAARTAGRRR